MIVYFMCFGRLPYIHADGISEEDEDLDQLRAEITRWPGFDDETRPRSDLPERLYKYLKRLLSVNPDDRPGTDEILSSIKGGISLGDANIAQDDYNTRLPGMDHSARQSRRSPFLSAPGARPTSRAGGTNIDSRSPSPMKKQQASETDPLLPPETSTTLGLRQTLSNVPTLRRNDSAHPSPRLLLPPPPLTRQERYIQNVTRAVQQPAVLLTLRTGLFLAKVVSCVAPCSNNAVQPWLLYPLLMFAAIDLGEFHLPLRYSILLLLLHMAVVLVATRQDVLCVGG
jgi:serine/threonine protein kinase